MSRLGMSGSQWLAVLFAIIIAWIFAAGLWEGNKEWKRLIANSLRLKEKFCSDEREEKSELLRRAEMIECTEATKKLSTPWFSFVSFFSVSKLKQTFFPDSGGESIWGWLIKQKIAEMVNPLNLWIMCGTLVILSLTWSKLHPKERKADVASGTTTGAD